MKKTSPKASPNAVSSDNYVRNNSTLRAARHIATARSVSSLLGAGSATGLPPTPAPRPAPPQLPPQQPAFDLSQTFEEFKLDECELGEEDGMVY